MCLVCFDTIAQNDSTSNQTNENINEHLNQNIEILSEQLQSEDIDLSSLTENWLYYKSHPINLNNSNKEDLNNLQLLTDIQINNLLMHLEKNGYLISIYELQSIEGFDLNTIEKILPFVFVSDLFNTAFFNTKEMFKDGKHELVYRFQRILESQLGYTISDSIKKIKPNSYYKGNPNRIFTRYSFRYNNNVSFSVEGEKDAGEQFNIGGNKIDSIPLGDGTKRADYHETKGFDFYSGHLSIKNIKNIKAFIIGDFQATFGQGLTLWQGFAFGKSSSILSIKRNANGIKAYKSFDENRFFRGIATTFKIKKIEITSLASYKKIDANASVTDTLSNGEYDIIRISNIEVSGLHNTNALMKNKGIIHQSVFGLNTAYNKRNFHLGLTLQNMNLSAELIKPITIYNQFDFQGKSNIVGGIDYNYIIKNTNYFGEFAISKNGGKALCQGIIIALDPKLTFTAHYRNFEKNFQNLFGNAISENTLPQNEQGICIGIEAKLFKSLTFSTYIDQYKFNWLKSNASSPSIGKDFFSQINFTPTKKIDMYVRYKLKTKYINDSENNFYDYLISVNQSNIRYNLSVQITPDIKLKSRIEYTKIHKNLSNSENGIVFIQDIIFKKLKSPVSFTFRYTLFDTKNFDSRIYTYENDVLYSYSVPALYYKGQRSYLIINWDITRYFEIWIRLAQTIYDNQFVQSPNTLNQINSNHKTEIKLQARLKF